MADVQYGKPNPSSGFPIKAFDISGSGTAYIEGVGLVGWDPVGLQWLKVKVDGTGQVFIANPGGTTTSIPSGTQTVAGAVTVSGTVTVIPSGTQAVSQTGSPWGVTISTATSGGSTLYRNINQGTAGTAIKTSAGNLYGYYMANNATGFLFVKLYNVSTTPTSTDTPVLTLPIPGSAAANVTFPIPASFSAGIGVRATTAVADNDATAPAANQAIINLYYS